MEAQEIRTSRDDAEVRRGIEAALARRHDKFVLNDLSWTADGYTVRFRLGAMDIVKTAVEVGVFDTSCCPRVRSRRRGRTGVGTGPRQAGAEGATGGEEGAARHQ